MRCGGCRVDFPSFFNYCRYCGRRLRSSVVDVSYQTNPLQPSALQTRPKKIVSQGGETVELLPRPIRMHVRTEASAGFASRVRILLGTGRRWVGRAIFHGLNLIM